MSRRLWLLAVSSVADPERFAAAAARFARHHAEDPRTVTRGNETSSASQDYHARLSMFVLQLDPEASEVVRLAALCQHVRRFELGRDAFPATPQGYKRWRSEQTRRQVAIAAGELEATGYDAATIERVVAILSKRNLRDDADAALLEDAVCLRFVVDELATFATGRSDEDLVRILRKTWDKLSPRGRWAVAAAVAGLPASLRALVARATAQ